MQAQQVQQQRVVIVVHGNDAGSHVSPFSTSETTSPHGGSNAAGFSANASSSNLRDTVVTSFLQAANHAGHRRIHVSELFTPKELAHEETWLVSETDVGRRCLVVPITTLERRPAVVDFLLSPRVAAAGIRAIYNDYYESLGTSSATASAASNITSPPGIGALAGSPAGLIDKPHLSLITEFPPRPNLFMRTPNEYPSPADDLSADTLLPELDVIRILNPKLQHHTQQQQQQQQQQRQPNDQSHDLAYSLVNSTPGGAVLQHGLDEQSHDHPIDIHEAYFNASGEHNDHELRETGFTTHDSPRRPITRQSSIFNSYLTSRNSTFDDTHTQQGATSTQGTGGSSTTDLMLKDRIIIRLGAEGSDGDDDDDEEEEVGEKEHESGKEQPDQSQEHNESIGQSSPIVLRADSWRMGSEATIELYKAIAIDDAETVASEVRDGLVTKIGDHVEDEDSTEDQFAGLGSGGIQNLDYEDEELDDGRSPTTRGSPDARGSDPRRRRESDAGITAVSLPSSILSPRRHSSVRLSISPTDSTSIRSQLVPSSSTGATTRSPKHSRHAFGEGAEHLQSPATGKSVRIHPELTEIRIPYNSPAHGSDSDMYRHDADIRLTKATVRRSSLEKLSALLSHLRNVKQGLTKSSNTLRRIRSKMRRLRVQNEKEQKIYGFPNSSENQVDNLLNGKRNRFPEPLETTFWKEYENALVLLFRIVLIAVICLNTLAVASDYMVVFSEISDTRKFKILLLRFVGINPLSIFLLLCTFSNFFRIKMNTKEITKTPPGQIKFWAQVSEFVLRINTKLMESAPGDDTLSRQLSQNNSSDVHSDPQSLNQSSQAPESQQPTAMSKSQDLLALDKAVEERQELARKHMAAAEELAQRQHFLKSFEDAIAAQEEAAMAVRPPSRIRLLLGSVLGEARLVANLLTMFYGIGLGALLILISYYGNDPDHGIYIVLTFSVFLFTGLPWWLSLGVMSFIWVIFNVMNFYVTYRWRCSAEELALRGPYQCKLDEEQHRSDFWQSMGYFLLSLAAITAVQMQLERAIRRAYAQHKMLDYYASVRKEILQQLLPPTIVEGIHQGLSPGARFHRHAAVLFADLFDFKRRATLLKDPAFVVRYLHEVFRRFDQLLVQYPYVSKIETIGEVYMAAAGVVDSTVHLRNASADSYVHIAQLCHLALDMHEAMRQAELAFVQREDGRDLWQETEPTPEEIKQINELRATKLKRDKEAEGTKEGILYPINYEEVAGMRKFSLESNYEYLGSSRYRLPRRSFELRIGINSGGVTSGVIGVTLPRYKLFGDAVNTASRLETNSIPGYTQLSEEAFKHISGDNNFIFAKRKGLINMKGKGEVQTYFLLGRHRKPGVYALYESIVESADKIEHFAVACAQYIEECVQYEERLRTTGRVIQDYPEPPRAPILPGSFAYGTLDRLVDGHCVDSEIPKLASNPLLLNPIFHVVCGSCFDPLLELRHAAFDAMANKLSELNARLHKDPSAPQYTLCSFIRGKIVFPRVLPIHEREAMLDATNKLCKVLLALNTDRRKTEYDYKGPILATIFFLVNATVSEPGYCPRMEVLNALVPKDYHRIACPTLYPEDKLTKGTSFCLSPPVDASLDDDHHSLASQTVVSFNSGGPDNYTMAQVGGVSRLNETEMAQVETHSTVGVLLSHQNPANQGPLSTSDMNSPQLTAISSHLGVLPSSKVLSEASSNPQSKPSGPTPLERTAGYSLDDPLSQTTLLRPAMTFLQLIRHLRSSESGELAIDEFGVGLELAADDKPPLDRPASPTAGLSWPTHSAQQHDQLSGMRPSFTAAQISTVMPISDAVSVAGSANVSVVTPAAPGRIPSTYTITTDTSATGPTAGAALTAAGVVSGTTAAAGAPGQQAASDEPGDQGGAMGKGFLWSILNTVLAKREASIISDATSAPSAGSAGANAAAAPSGTQGAQQATSDRESFVRGRESFIRSRDSFVRHAPLLRAQTQAHPNVQQHQGLARIPTAQATDIASGIAASTTSVRKRHVRSNSQLPQSIPEDKVQRSHAPGPSPTHLPPPPDVAVRRIHSAHGLVQGKSRRASHQLDSRMGSTQRSAGLSVSPHGQAHGFSYGADHPSHTTAPVTSAPQDDQVRIHRRVHSRQASIELTPVARLRAKDEQARAVPSAEFLPKLPAAVMPTITLSVPNAAKSPTSSHPPSRE